MKLKEAMEIAKATGKTVLVDEPITPDPRDTEKVWQSRAERKSEVLEQLWEKHQALEARAEKLETENARLKAQFDEMEHLCAEAEFDHLKLKERAEKLVEALRKSILWGESMYGRAIRGDAENVNWTSIKEAREALEEWESNK